MTFNEAKEAAQKWANLHGEPCVVTRSIFGFDPETLAEWNRANGPKPSLVCTLRPTADTLTGGQNA